ncbi:hypothetical protein FHS04_000799 [Mesoflavibacter sabulilitoris]|uniref:hypothetical protein n=1 Tax=Mesoflavibacter zeaxanthinifaciens TaxID=393060 RepID=UPI0011B226A7|nr:hypothetical protein [Mesoflavibacter zeaxanthinifaciens]MBB3123302.1 hypothetical protein [Mesoflavibacter zeaxanthinifaciens subsp. sabulilitoris]
MKKINIKYFSIFIILLVISFFVREFKDELLGFLKTILNSNTLFYIITISIFFITILHKIRYNELNLENISNSKEFKSTLAEFISSITDPSTFICAIAILKGLFLDYFFNDSYFTKFETPEKVFILIASFYFFITSFLEIKEMFLELMSPSSEVKATDKKVL